jgi:hypothetical protein
MTSRGEHFMMRFVYMRASLKLGSPAPSRHIRRRRMIASLALVAGLFAASSRAEDAALSGPFLGYVRKAGDVVRPVLGVPGAARFGPVLETGGAEIAATCSEAGYAVTLSSGIASILRLRDGVSVPLFSEPIPDLKSVRCSSTGTAVALLRGTEADIFTGLPDNPVQGKAFALAAPASQVAVSDDGEALASLSGGVLSVSTRAEQRQIGVFDELHALDFRPGSHDLLYADRSIRDDCFVRCVANRRWRGGWSFDTAQRVLLRKRQPGVYHRLCDTGSAYCK